MGFVWDRRKIKMLYGPAVSEMSRKIVCFTCVENLKGGGGRVMHVTLCARLVRVLLRQIVITSH